MGEVKRRRPGSVRTRVLVAVGAAIVMAAGPTTAPSTAAASTGTSLSPVSSASTSSRGVTRHSINVVFPVVSLSSLAGREGFAQDAEYGEQTKAIELFVKQVNAGRGVNSRKINPIISGYDPTNETQMRALCKTWTEGSPAAFAVVDGLGAWTGDNQLCITQEGHTPFLGAWTTVTNWSKVGSPYLWWIGPDQATILQAVVNWGLSTNLIGGTTKVGVIAGSRASDQLALNSYLLPDLRRAGIDPIVKTIDADPNDTATTGTQSPLVIQQLRSAGVTSIIPLIPFNVFFPVLQAETAQQYFPRLLLSDYESSILSSLGLLPIPYAKALDGQEGVTTETLGGIDDPRPASQGGYDAGVRQCWTVWHRAYPQAPPGNINDFIEEQGPVVGWCQAIHLFETAAQAAGPGLNRRTFVTAMSRIKNFPGTWSPVLSYGPNKRYGPTQYQVVKLHVNSPPSSLCKQGPGQPAAMACWVDVEPWQPLPAG